MSRSIRLMMGVAALLVLCRAAAERSEATVVRAGKNGPVNPAVEVGGHKLDANRPAMVFPASLIGALRPAYPWLPSCVAWPLGSFGPFYWDRRDEAPRMVPGEGSILRLRPGLTGKAP
jgi:hypothetical protein